MKNRNIPGLDKIAIPRVLQKILMTIIVVYTLVVGVLFSVQRDLMFHPMKGPQNKTPMLVGATQYWKFTAPPGEKVTELTRFCERDDHGKRGAIVYFHGNAEAASSAEKYRKFYPGCDLYALDIPGFEGAAGKPSEASALSATEDLIKQISADGYDLAKTLVIGRSLGTGLAVYWASKHPCLMEGLFTPYENLADVAFDHYPFLPTSLLVLDSFDASERAPKAQCSVWMVAANDDQVVSERHAYNLSKIWNPKHDAVVVYYSATHNNIVDLPSTWDGIAAAAHKVDVFNRGKSH